METVLESDQPARSKEEVESNKVKRFNNFIGMGYVMSAVFRQNRHA